MTSKKLRKYYLDLEKVSKLDIHPANQIHEYYRLMLMADLEGNLTMRDSYFNTLKNVGFLVEEDKDPNDGTKRINS